MHNVAIDVTPVPGKVKQFHRTLILKGIFVNPGPIKFDVLGKHMVKFDVFGFETSQSHQVAGNLVATPVRNTNT